MRYQQTHPASWPEPVPDPRVARVLAANPGLATSGADIISQVLAAADAAGIIPPSRTETRYGIDYRPRGGGIYTMLSLASAHDLNNSGSEAGGIRGAVLTSTRTTFDPIDSPWVPAPALEDSRV